MRTGDQLLTAIGARYSVHAAGVVDLCGFVSIASPEAATCPAG
jgi:hypothetical protein